MLNGLSKSLHCLVFFLKKADDDKHVENAGDFIGRNSCQGHVFFRNVF